MAYTNTVLRDAGILQDFTAWVDGFGMIGTVENLQLPEINIQMEGFRGGGMDTEAEIPMGYEKMECSYDLLNWDTYAYQNIAYTGDTMSHTFNFQGNLLHPITGVQEPVLIQIVGGFKSIKQDSIQPGKKSKHSVKMTVRKYRHSVNNQVITDIDIFNKVFTTGGVDRTAQARSNLGITGATPSVGVVYTS